MEFKKAMTIIRRMCNNGEANCDKCPLFLNHNCSVRPWADSDVVRVEGILEDWATEHTEPQYPTWSEWLEEITGEWCDGDLLFSRIPESTAKRLGVKPKEAK